MVSDPTLFWMPHCPLGLYNQLISTNFTCAALSNNNNLIIIGNTFSSYSLRKLPAQLKKEAPFIDAIIAYTNSFQIPSSLSAGKGKGKGNRSKVFLQEFGDISVHWWSSDILSELNDSFWDLKQQVIDDGANNEDAEIL